MKIEIDVPEPLWQGMQARGAEDWAAVALRAFDARVKELGAHSPESRRNASFHIGYNWARDRAPPRDLVAMVDAPSYASAAAIVRKSAGFSQRDEFGDALSPSDEMWEAFVDGATARYNDVAAGR